MEKKCEYTRDEGLSLEYCDNPDQLSIYCLIKPEYCERAKIEPIQPKPEPEPLEETILNLLIALTLINETISAIKAAGYEKP